MKKIINNICFFIVTLLSFTMLMSSCSKEAAQNANVESPMLFGIKSVAESKVSYNGPTASFSKDDQVGVYAFYNNFYHFYKEYQNFAESVIFSNKDMRVKNSNSISNLTYSPLKSWTFSTIYGTAPFKLDVVAYYPYNTENIEMKNSNDTTAATLVYSYYKDINNINSNVNFMTAHTIYEKDANDITYTPETFRAAMLNLENIDLRFRRQTAALNLKVSKPIGYINTIKIKSLEVEFHAPKTFTQTVHPETTNWSTIDYKKDPLLHVNASFITPTALIETQWDDELKEYDATNIPLLFNQNSSNMLYFPPGTDINRIDFIIEITQPNGDIIETDAKYTWHPHIAPIEGNTTFILNLELDPKRAN